MLEYLLLRPRDSEVFTQQRLQYVILDEAHTYSGAQGIEVGLLMRRLQQAFPECRLQFILTSATLGKDRAAIADFGRKLTGKPFDTEDVVLGDPSSPFQQSLQPRRSLSAYAKLVPDDTALNRWLAALDDVGRLRELVRSSGLDCPPAVLEYPDSARLLAAWLDRNADLAALHVLASERPVTLKEAAWELWGDESDSAVRAAEWLVALGARATSGPETAPLLPARYHLFFRGLRGGTVCVSTKCSGRSTHPGTNWGHLVLEDVEHCPECGSHGIPLLTCVHCGSPFLRIHTDGAGRWQSTAPTVATATYILTWNNLDFEDAADDQGFKETRLCLNCRSMAAGADLASTCCDRPDHVGLWVVPDADADGALKRCPVCRGERAGFASVLRDFGTGEDAATAVLAEAMIRALPKEEAQRPANGRRMLAFSDSRQRAAYFAPYLARTTAETQYMRPLVDAISEEIGASGGSGASFDDIARRFLKRAEEQPYVIIRRTSEDDGEFTSEIKSGSRLRGEDRQALRRESLLALVHHFTSSPLARNTIPGLAIASCNYDWNGEQRHELPRRLPTVFRDGEEWGFAALQNLVQIFLRRKAIVLPDGITLAHLMRQGPKTVAFHRESNDTISGRQRYRWNSYKAQAQRDRVVRRSQQAEVVAQLLGKDKFRDNIEIAGILEAIWDAFRDFEVMHPSAEDPNEYRVPYGHLTVRQDETWHFCRRCGAPTIFPVRDACLRPGCGGALTRFTRAEIERLWQHHHWYHRYTRTDALPLEVKEHTAQLTNEAGADYQRKFMDRRINVLSSSTTFELGIDVGQLKSVFLRNVPPTGANYIQRAGRAGRRKEGAAYAVSYARSFPHDQTHYHDPQSIVSGVVPVPRINLANPRLTQRHINSFLLGAYLRDTRVASATEQINVAEFFLAPDVNQSAGARFTEWVGGSRARLTRPVRQIIDRNCPLDVEEAFRTSFEEMASTFLDLQDDVGGFERQEAELEEMIRNSQGPARRNAVWKQDSVRRLADELRATRLIDYLSSAHWLPSYAFPQSVVKLLVRQDKVAGRMRLERDAEYGIAEYAPGSEIVADGYLLTSRGLDLRNRELRVRAYRVCSRCNRVQIEDSRDRINPVCSSCGAFASGPRSTPRLFVEPRGFTTLVDEPVQEVRLYRLKPPPNSEVFLIEGAPQEAFGSHPDIPGITLGYRADGRLFRGNSGHRFQQFRLCPKCGRGFERAPSRNAGHDNPWGASCPNRRLIQADLVYQFETDTLQVRFEGVSPQPPGIGQIDFWSSLQTAFVGAAAEVLAIPSRDIDGTFRSQTEQSPRGELVIFDRVPGGAGYVARIREELPRVLQETYRRTDDCRNPACDRQGSCYACLRSYGNQFRWQYLHRDLVADWLAQVLRLP
jgi:hypothetical protein